MQATIKQLIVDAKQQLIQAGIDNSPKIDAEILLAKALNKNRTYLYTWPEKIIVATAQAKFQALLLQRLTGKPIAYILGIKEFWGLEFSVNNSTLIPRADTEILVEQALKLIQNKNNASVLDLGTGTGAIICAIKHELPNIIAYAVDFDEKTLDTAVLNAKSLNIDVDFIKSNWFTELALTSKFDLIVANPPYIEEQDLHLTQKDLMFEPITALSSGKDGLLAIKQICQQAPSYLADNGWLVIEHGYNQAKQVTNIMQKNNFKQLKTIKDYGNKDRVTLGRM